MSFHLTIPFQMYQSFYTQYLHTCLESPPHPHTLGAAHCRHNVVVCGVSSELLRDGNGCNSTQGGGSVPVDQVGVG